MNKIYIVTTQGCQACNIIKNIINSIYVKHEYEFEYASVDRNNVPELISNNVVLEDFPTVVFVKNKVIKYNFKGTKPVKEIEQILYDIDFN